MSDMDKLAAIEERAKDAHCGDSTCSIKSCLSIADVPALVAALRIALAQIDRIETAAADYLYAGEDEDEWKRMRRELLDALQGEKLILAVLSSPSREAE